MKISQMVFGLQSGHDFVTRDIFCDRDFFLWQTDGQGKNNMSPNPLWGDIIIHSGANSNSFELLCLSSLSASLTNIQWKVTEKKWRHHFFHSSRVRYSKMTSQIRAKFELIQDFMPVLVTCKFEREWIHSNWEKMETPFFPFKVKGRIIL